MLSSRGTSSHKRDSELVHKKGRTDGRAAASRRLRTTTGAKIEQKAPEDAPSLEHVAHQPPKGPEPVPQHPYVKRRSRGEDEVPESERTLVLGTPSKVPSAVEKNGFKVAISNGVRSQSAGTTGNKRSSYFSDEEGNEDESESYIGGRIRVELRQPEETPSVDYATSNHHAASSTDVLRDTSRHAHASSRNEKAGGRREHSGDYSTLTKVQNGHTLVPGTQSIPFTDQQDRMYAASMNGEISRGTEGNHLIASVEKVSSNTNFRRSSVPGVEANTFPASRVALWDRRPTGESINVGTEEATPMLVLKESVLRGLLDSKRGLGLEAMYLKGNLMHISCIHGLDADDPRLRDAACPYAIVLNEVSHAQDTRNNRILNTLSTSNTSPLRDGSAMSIPPSVLAACWSSAESSCSEAGDTCVPVVTVGCEQHSSDATSIAAKIGIGGGHQEWEMKARSCIENTSLASTTALSHLMTLRVSAAVVKNSSPSLRLHAHAFIPSVCITFTPVSAPPILQSALLSDVLAEANKYVCKPAARPLLSSTPTNIEQPQVRLGLLTLTATRRAVLLPETGMENDTPVVGIWGTHINSLDHPLFWSACIRYLLSKSLEGARASPAPQTFLAAILHPRQAEGGRSLYNDGVRRPGAMPAFEFFEAKASIMESAGTIPESHGDGFPFVMMDFAASTDLSLASGLSGIVVNNVGSRSGSPQDSNVVPSVSRTHSTHSHVVRGGEAWAEDDVTVIGRFRPVDLKQPPSQQHYPTHTHTSTVHTPIHHPVVSPSPTRSPAEDVRSVRNSASGSKSIRNSRHSGYSPLIDKQLEPAIRSLEGLGVLVTPDKRTHETHTNVSEEKSKSMERRRERRLSAAELNAMEPTARRVLLAQQKQLVALQEEMRRLQSAVLLSTQNEIKAVNPSDAATLTANPVVSTGTNTSAVFMSPISPRLSSREVPSAKDPSAGASPKVRECTCTCTPPVAQTTAEVVLNSVGVGSISPSLVKTFTELSPARDKLGVPIEKHDKRDLGADLRDTNAADVRLVPGDSVHGKVHESNVDLYLSTVAPSSSVLDQNIPNTALREEDSSIIISAGESQAAQISVRLLDPSIGTIMHTESVSKSALQSTGASSLRKNSNLVMGRPIGHDTSLLQHTLKLLSSVPTIMYGESQIFNRIRPNSNDRGLDPGLGLNYLSDEGETMAAIESKYLSSRGQDTLRL